MPDHAAKTYGPAARLLLLIRETYGTCVCGSVKVNNKRSTTRMQPTALGTAQATGEYGPRHGLGSAENADFVRSTVGRRPPP